MFKKDETRRAFEDLKRGMTCILVLALPNFKKPFMVYVDASGDRIGVVLVQKKKKTLGIYFQGFKTYE